MGNRTHLTVVLKENNQLLDDVVVIGYGVQKKVNLTGSVAVRQMSEIENQPMTHASQALYSMPGVYINQASSKPGSDGATIRIRGVGTMSSSSPRVLVDGMEVGHGAGDSKKEAEQRAAFSVSQYMSDEQCASLLDKVDRLEGTRSGSGF